MGIFSGPCFSLYFSIYENNYYLLLDLIYWWWLTSSFCRFCPSNLVIFVLYFSVFFIIIFVFSKWKFTSIHVFLLKGFIFIFIFYLLTFNNKCLITFKSISIFSISFFFICQSSVDFPQSHQDWTSTDPMDLFQAPIVKNEANPKVPLFWFSYDLCSICFLSGSFVLLSNQRSPVHNLVAWICSLTICYFLCDILIVLKLYMSLSSLILDLGFKIFLCSILNLSLFKIFYGFVL